MPKGYLFLVLHAHLPYVRHPEYDRFLEERWLFEAVTETYVPLVKFFDRLRDEGLAFRLTLSISPTGSSVSRLKIVSRVGTAGAAGLVSEAATGADPRRGMYNRRPSASA